MEVLRYAAFTDDPSGGNPAGVVLDAAGAADEEMLAVAAEVGYSETAFVTRSNGDREYDVRYFSPVGEVAFCGHATIATAVALPQTGTLRFHTVAGLVSVETDSQRATLTSVEPAICDMTDLAPLLEALGW